MGECPVCKRKYSQSVEYCPECRVGVIPEFNKTLKEKKKNFVEVYRTQDIALAGLIKEVLEDHEILCYLDSYFFAHISPLFSPVKVMVYKENIEEAREILRLFFKED